MLPFLFEKESKLTTMDFVIGQMPSTNFLEMKSLANTAITPITSKPARRILTNLSKRLQSFDLPLRFSLAFEQQEAPKVYVQEVKVPFHCPVKLLLQIELYPISAPPKVRSVERETHHSYNGNTGAQQEVLALAENVDH